MRATTFTTVAFAGALLLGACDSSTTRPLQLTSGGSDLLVAVSPADGSVNPAYSWTGDRARMLEVVNLDTGALVWRVHAMDDVQGFGDPVRHGVVPTGGVQSGQANLLEADARYRVVVETVGGERGTFEFIP